MEKRTNCRYARRRERVHYIHYRSVAETCCGQRWQFNILEPLYEACLTRMGAFVADLERSGESRAPKKYEDFRATLTRVCAEHYPSVVKNFSPHGECVCMGKSRRYQLYHGRVMRRKSDYQDVIL